MSFLWAVGRFCLTTAAMFLSLFGFTFILIDNKAMKNGLSSVRDVTTAFASPSTLLLISLPNRVPKQKPKSKPPLKLA